MRSVALGSSRLTLENRSSCVETFEKVKGLDFSERPLLVSVLAGITLNRLEHDFPNHACVRAVPNTPALVGAGLTGLSCDKELGLNQIALVKNMFKRY